MSGLRGTVQERMLRYISPEPNSGCWLWTGSTTVLGYGQIGAGGRYGKPLMAHRVSYEMHIGPIPKGLELDHLCRVPCCVNPKHLSPVTHAENLRRGTCGGDTWGKMQRAKTHCARGHLFDAGNTITHGVRKYRKCRICMRAARARWCAANKRKP
jgi:hypothetical protein